VEAPDRREEIERAAAAPGSLRASTHIM
jgi:hypothetical protein